MALMAHSGRTDDAGDDGTIDVVVEIPRGSRNKYEYDHEKGVIRLDRRLFSATVYPADYGFIPDTLGLDGDPLDALVLLEDPTFPGCWVRSRPVGMLVMQDEAGEDAKIICVPPDDPRWDNIRELDDLSESLRAEIRHFFDVYKLIEPGKQSTTRRVRRTRRRLGRDHGRRALEWSAVPAEQRWRRSVPRPSLPRARRAPPARAEAAVGASARRAGLRRVGGSARGASRLPRRAHPRARSSLDRTGS